MKKRGMVIFAVFLILFSLNVVLVNGQSQLRGVKICNLNNECGVSDGICPEMFFSPGTSCYIEDPDCCKINKAGWSSSSNSDSPISSINEGQSVYIYVETTNCNNKDANFEVYRVKERLLLSDEEFLVTSFGPKKVTSDKLSVKWSAYVDPNDLNELISKFKFKVKINPSASSPLIQVSSSSSSSRNSIVDLSCSDSIDNDADGCSDETDDCADGKEDCNFAFDLSCSKCAGYTDSCAGWKCNIGECLNGYKSIICPNIPEGCSLAMPPPYIKCYEKSVPFSFFSGFNAAIVIFLLIGYYGYRIYKKKI